MARLGDICTINPRIKTFQDDFMVSFVPMQNVSEEGTVDASIIKYYGEVKKGFTYFQENDVLFAKITPCMENGKGGIARNLKNGVAFGSTEFHVLRPNPNFMISSWLYYLTSWPEFRKECEKNMTGSAGQKRVPKTFLENYEIQLPELDEQRKIAAVLDKVSDLIAKRRQQLDKLDELIKARFVEMFGDPVSNPKGWQLVPLGECVTTIDNGKSFVCSNETRKNEWPAILKLSAVTYGEYNSNENKALLDSSQFIENAEVHSGDLLFTRKNTPELVGMAAYVYSSPAKLMMPDLIFRLNTKDNCSKIFLWQLINHELFRKNIQNIASGSAKSMSNISKERLMQLVIYLPPIKLQNHFAAFVEQTEKTKTTISKSLEKLETLKKALMQEYFG